MVSISVALCTYNGARFVERQLVSILEQIQMPAEIVISDDDSTDATLEIVRTVSARYASAGVSIRVLPVDGNRGVTRNFERAVRACTGDLIALSDQDDVWHADRLSSAIPRFATTAILLQHSDARLVDEEGRPLEVSLLDALWVSDDERDALRSGRAFEALIRRNLVTGATVLFRRSLLETALPFPSDWVHDEWLAIVAAALGELRLLDAELIDYRQHGGNQIGAQKPTLRYRIRRMLEPRGERYERLARRSQQLADRMRAMPVPESVKQLALDRARFDDVRARLPRARIKRVRPVAREWRSGTYRTLSSQGNLDVLRDLLQPA